MKKKKKKENTNIKTGFSPLFVLFLFILLIRLVKSFSPLDPCFPMEPSTSSPIPTSHVTPILIPMSLADPSFDTSIPRVVSPLHLQLLEDVLKETSQKQTTFQSTQLSPPSLSRGSRESSSVSESSEIFPVEHRIKRKKKKIVDVSISSSTSTFKTIDSTKQKEITEEDDLHSSPSMSPHHSPYASYPSDDRRSSSAPPTTTQTLFSPRNESGHVVDATHMRDETPMN